MAFARSALGAQHQLEKILRTSTKVLPKTVLALPEVAATQKSTRVQKKPRIAYAIATPLLSPLNISEFLQSKNLGHYVIGYSTTRKWWVQYEVKGKLPFGFLPVICHKLTDLRRIQYEGLPVVAIVCDSFGAIAHSNVPCLATDNLEELWNEISTLVESDLSNTFILQTFDPPLMDYVAIASKPSDLNKMLTVIMKIHPYDLRKQVQTTLISYLAGKIKESQLKQVLYQSIKAETLIPLIQKPEVQKLRNVLLTLQHKTAPDQEVEEIAEAEGIDVFDINYILTSFHKDPKKKARGK